MPERERWREWLQADLTEPQLNSDLTQDPLEFGYQMWNPKGKCWGKTKNERAQGVPLIETKMRVGLKIWLNLKSRQQKLGSIMIDMNACEGGRKEGVGTASRWARWYGEWNPEHFQRKCITFGTKTSDYGSPPNPLSSLVSCVGLNPTPALPTLISIWSMGLSLRPPNFMIFCIFCLLG